jgi:hypothetical protein
MKFVYAFAPLLGVNEHLSIRKRHWFEDVRTVIVVGASLFTNFIP